jgi:hypothetical protein
MPERKDNGCFIKKKKTEEEEEERTLVEEKENNPAIRLNPHLQSQRHKIII